jgi:hypothetical protein
MADSTPSKTGAGHASTPLDTASGSQQHEHNPIEMDELDPSKKTVGAGSHSGLLNGVSIPTTTPLSSSFPVSTSMSPTGIENVRPEQPPSTAISADLSSFSDPRPAPTASRSGASSTPPPGITRLDSVAIGPADAAPPPVITEAGPVLVITLLLTSGARHPYKIDEKYLTKRNVNVPGVTESGKKDPFSISVYTLKELILREWREEWEAQPSSPSSIRLIYFGRLLDDKTPLKGMLFQPP